MYLSEFNLKRVTVEQRLYHRDAFLCSNIYHLMLYLLFFKAPNTPIQSIFVSLIVFLFVLYLNYILLGNRVLVFS